METVASVNRTKFLGPRKSRKNTELLFVFPLILANFTDFIMEDSRLGCPFFVFFYRKFKASKVLHNGNPMRSE